MYKTIDIYITNTHISLASEDYRTTRYKLTSAWMVDDIVAIAQSYACEMQAYDESYHDLLCFDDCCDGDCTYLALDYDIVEIIVRPVHGCLHLQAVVC